MSLILSLIHILPSGVDADTGKAALALKADLTVTMVAPKPGLYLYPGALYAGAVKVHTIGTPKQVEEEAKSTMTLLDDAFVAPLLPHRPKNAHKGTNGRIALVAGSRGYICLLYTSYGMGNGADAILDRLDRLDIPVNAVFASDEFVRGQVFRGLSLIHI